MKSCFESLRCFKKHHNLFSKYYVYANWLKYSVNCLLFSIAMEYIKKLILLVMNKANKNMHFCRFNFIKLLCYQNNLKASKNAIANKIPITKHKSGFWVEESTKNLLEWEKMLQSNLNSAYILYTIDYTILCRLSHVSAGIRWSTQLPSIVRWSLK